MRKREINKGVILTIYCIIMFFVFLFGISAIMNHGNTDMTMEMAEATFPVVTFRYDGQDLNRLHGYANAMDVSTLREHITPLMEGRMLSVRIDTYGTKITEVGYEVRSLDGERLIEDTKLYNYVVNGDEITVDFEIKDLIMENTEYSFCLKLITDKEQEIRYYTRIVEADGYGVSEKLEYVYYFSDTTFDKIKASDELPTYLESNAQGDNTTFHRVDIHSSLDQVTWGSLNVTRVTEPIAYLKELDEETAHLELQYFVSIPNSRGDVFYEVTEYFRVRLGTERIYLLDYERNMEQIFHTDTATIANNKLVLGITSDEVSMKESSDGNRVAFVNAGKLYSYNITDNKLAVIFGFFDQEVTDPRNAYMEHDIRIFQIDETGNVHFMVYGYMNRGNHEGEMGIAVYYYDSILNTVEEEAFIPYDSSFEMLKENMDQLAYVNGSNEFFFYLDNALYRIELGESVCEKFVEDIPYGSFMASESMEMAVWAMGTETDTAPGLVYYNFVTGRQSSIMAEENEYVRAIGFFGNDLIYGMARQNDYAKDISGELIYPMYRIIIRDERGSILKDYAEENIYITDTLFADNMVTLHRIKRTDDGDYIETTDDQILNNGSVMTGKNYVEVVAIDVYEKIVQLVVKREINTETMQILTPKLVIYEGNRTFTPEQPEEISFYYVYVKGSLEGIYENVADAVAVAYESGGVVINEDGYYIFRKEMRGTRNQIMAITGAGVEDGDGAEETLAVCLEQILLYEGITKDCDALLLRGMSAEEIIEENLPEAEVLDLTGDSLEAMLYYVERDIPVLVEFADGSAVLLVGYNELNTVIMNPLGNSLNQYVYKVGMNDSTEWFLENGNRFTTYVFHED